MLATMKYRIMYEKIEQCGQKGLATPGYIASGHARVDVVIAML